MIGWVSHYVRWLHGQWPAGEVEKLPLVHPDGSTNVPGLYIVGDLTGIPLLKFSADTGARAIQTIVADPAFQRREAHAAQAGHKVHDVVVIGGGVSGMAAALEASKHALDCVVVEASEPFSTIVNFPKGKPIYTYPAEMTPAGDLQFSEAADVKEKLLAELRDQIATAGIVPKLARVERVARERGVLRVVLSRGDELYAHRVVVGIGRSGNYRKLDVPGEALDKVYNRLHDPKDFCGKKALVVGGGDSALETAIALGTCGAEVTLSYRKPEFSRPKPENIEQLKRLSGRSGRVRLMMSSKVKEIRDTEVAVRTVDGSEETFANDIVFTMIGREPPLDFLRRSGVRIRGTWRARTWIGLVTFLLFCTWMYHWKSGKAIPFVGPLPGWLNPDPIGLFGKLAKSLDEAARNLYWATHGPSSWPGGVHEFMSGTSPPRPGAWLAACCGALTQDRTSLLGTIAKSASERSFWYTLAYSLVVVIFGIRRIRRRKTPYVKVQTLCLMTVQVLPLFVIPEILLPWMGANGWFDAGAGAWVKHEFFPGGSWWRAYGLVLAWPLFVYNWFTAEPLWGWLVIGAIQTFAIIPVLVHRFGKGAYCGWICSCGALAETMGDQHRHKMPHGPGWNRANMIGQGVLLFAAVLMILRIAGWVMGADSGTAHIFDYVFSKAPFINYRWFVDLFLAGIVGYGLYFWYSGRVWCRFLCPLAALMHIYARFSRFRILADKKKCISCNVCTSVCHQGIDVMNFANKGRPMEDPECVRCSACVQMCPTGVLEFGQVDRRSGQVISRDSLVASLVREGESPS